MSKQFYRVLVLGFALFTASISAADPIRTLENRFSDAPASSLIGIVKLNEVTDVDTKRWLRKQHDYVVFLPESSLTQSGPHQYRVGFFTSKKEAEAFQKKAKDQKIQLSLGRLPKNNFAYIQQQLIRTSEAASLQTSSIIFLADSLKMRAMLETAKTAFVEKDYATAEQYYRVISLAEDDNVAHWAEELIGLCEERQNHRKTALTIYQRLEKELPEGGDRERIKQRIITLKTAADNPKNDLRTADKKQKTSPTTLSAMLSQDLLHLSAGTESDESRTVLNTHLDIRTNYAGQGYQLQFQGNGLLQNDFAKPENPDSRLDLLNIKYTHEYSQMSAVVGRQKNKQNGSFVRFDGATLSYPLLNSLSLGVSAGIPRYHSDIYDDLSSCFYSLYATSDLSENISINGYWINQTVESVTDRSAIGGSVILRGDRLSSIVNVDYDTTFGTLNVLSARSTLTIDAKTNASVTLAQQRSPFLLATNLRLNDPSVDLATELNETDNQTTLYDTVKNKTDINRYISANYTKRPNDNRLWTGDVYFGHVSAAPTQSYSDKYYFTASGQAIFFDWGSFDHATTLGLNTTLTSLNQASSVNVSERVNPGKRWSVSSGVTTGLKHVNLPDSIQQTTKLSAKIKYKPHPFREFSLETVKEFTSEFNSEFVNSPSYIRFNYICRF